MPAKNMKRFQCNPKGKRCNPMETVLAFEEHSSGRKGQITTGMQMTETTKKGKKTFALKLVVGYKPGRKEPLYLFNVCPFCEGRLLPETK